VFEKVVEFFQNEALYSGVNPDHDNDTDTEPYFKYGCGCFGSIRVTISPKQTKIQVLGESNPNRKSGGGVHYVGVGSNLNEAMLSLLNRYQEIFFEVSRWQEAYCAGMERYLLSEMADEHPSNDKAYELQRAIRWSM